jgi:hypothetical protein
MISMHSWEQMEAELSNMISDVCPIAEEWCPKPYENAGGEFDGSTGMNLNDGNALEDAEGGPIGGSFTFAANVEVSELSQWLRIFDFGNGPDADNIIAAQLANTPHLVFAVIKRGVVGYVIVENFFELNTPFHFMVSVSSIGTYSVYKDGELLLQLESSEDYAPGVIHRDNMFVGQSNWDWDPLWKGSITDIKIWGEVVDPDCYYSERILE